MTVFKPIIINIKKYIKWIYYVGIILSPHFKYPGQFCHFRWHFCLISSLLWILKNIFKIKILKQTLWCLFLGWLCINIETIKCSMQTLFFIILSFCLFQIWLFSVEYKISYFEELGDPNNSGPVDFHCMEKKLFQNMS